MPAKSEPSKVDIVVWALRKLGEDDYHFTSEGPEGGWELNLWEHSQESDASGEPPITDEDYEEIRRKVGHAFKKAFGSKSAAPGKLQGEEELVKIFLEPPLQAILGKYLMRWRGQLGASGRSKMESIAITLSHNDVRNAIVSQCLADFADRFPASIKRIERLRVLTARSPVPDEVQRYLDEACYISGRFLSCLIVCRSAIEFAMRDFLIREGKQKELDSLKTGRGDGLFAMIKLARGLRWKLEPTLDTADDIRRAASDAVHNKAPRPEFCEEAFLKTRGFLTELYS